ncbi:putative bifunctional diguanylate cyclase/phosphodiesterase [Symbioplanes lichenis]|uniref:putative bifunctional diguanylate cyclase/phosphodiesterase n=1 Tax=Symbioplanes lichenis TaxID=1629072 RepID=UPI0027397B51|nr:bifunctional diguanylate cyclase/phosphodiesterase [Actinoplanes lichenis]
MALGVVVLVGVVLVAARLITDPQGQAANVEFYRSYLITSVVATVVTWIAAGRGPADARRPWRWIALGFTALLVPQLLFIAVAARQEMPPLWVVMAVLGGRVLWAVLLVAGTLKFPMRPLTGRQRTRFLADMATVLGGAFVISWYFQLGPALTESGRLGFDQLTVLSLAVGDLGMIFGVCAVLMRNGLTTWRGPLPVFLAGLVTFLAGDLLYAHAILAGPLVWATPLSLTLNVADLIMAAAAAVHLRKPDATGAEPGRVSAGVAYLPYVALLSGYTMMLVAAVREGRAYPWGGLAVGVFVMTGAVVLRQLVALRENHHLVVHDHLTGLANRISADAALAAAVRRHRQDGQESAVLLIDLDGFKTINDTRGHEAGDALLAAFAGILTATVRTSDVAARVGGDEFVVVLDRPGSAERAVAVARRILDAAADPVLINGEELPIRASIGIAMTDPDADATTVRHRADMAMYAAKRAGHGTELWQPALPGRTAAEEAFDADLAGATAAGQLRVVYQPIVDLEDGSTVGVEALVRWEHPVLGTIAPDRFIAAAERTGVIHEIGLWVLARAAEQVRAWQTETGRSLYVSVNLSPRQLDEPGLVHDVARRLGDAGLRPQDLVLELTESALVEETSAVPALTRLRGLGVRIAVDDFGTGYSSLRYLTRLPVDILKLDRCFVAELNGDPQGSAVAEAVLRLAQALHLDTVAEGIETAEQAAELSLLGYRRGQGYHYARPMSPEEALGRVKLAFTNSHGGLP